MSTRQCSRNLRGEPIFGGFKAFAIIFALIVPAILGICALIEYHSIKTPEVTTASYCESSQYRYLRVINSKIDDFIEADATAAEMAHFEPTGNPETRQIANILGLDSEKTEILKNGTLLTYAKNGVKMTVSGNIIRIDGKYDLKLGSNGSLGNYWSGYNAEHESTIVVGGQKRSHEELATIAMVADSIDKAGDSYSYVNINGVTHGIWWTIFCIYLLIDIILSLVIMVIRRIIRS